MTMRTITFDDEQWQVVPREPTDSMFAAVDAENDRALVGGQRQGASFADMYYAALDAAPQPPAQQPMKPVGYTYTHERSGHVTFYAPGQCPSDDEGYVVEPVYRHPPAQQPTRDLLAEATEQVEALERENHRMRRCVARLMARLTVWLDDDQFNEADGIMYPEFEPPAQQPMTEDEIDEETRAATDALMDYIYEYGTGAEGSQQFILRIARAVETHHGIGKGKSTTKRNCPPPSWMFPGESDAG